MAEPISTPMKLKPGGNVEMPEPISIPMKLKPRDAPTPYPFTMPPKLKQDVAMTDPVSNPQKLKRDDNEDGPGREGIPIPAKLMRTQAEQDEINLMRIEAEKYKIRMDAKVENLNAAVAQMYGQQARVEEANRVSQKYDLFITGGASSSSSSMDVDSASLAKPRLDKVAEDILLKYQGQHQFLQEQLAASNQNVRQKTAEMEAQVKQAHHFAKLVVQTSDGVIKRNKAAQQDLEDKLRAAEASAAGKQDEIAALKRNQQEIYSVLLDKELSKSAKMKKERVAAVEEKRAKPTPNPAQKVPSQQPSGAQVEGPHRAVQANTGYAVPANPAPVANNTREDDKPLPLTAREGVAKRVPIKKGATFAKKKTETAKEKAIKQQNKEVKHPPHLWVSQTMNRL